MYKKSLLIFFSIIFVLVALCLKWYIQRQVMISHFFHLQKKLYTYKILLNTFYIIIIKLKSAIS